MYIPKSPKMGHITYYERITWWFDYYPRQQQQPALLSVTEILKLPTFRLASFRQIPRYCIGVLFRNYSTDSKSLISKKMSPMFFYLRFCQN
jgi:hypothetical protein